MKPFVPILTILFGFIATGTSLRCLECVNYNGSFCQGQSLECPERATGCIRSLALTKIGNEIRTSFIQACNDDEHLCHQKFSMNSGDKYKRVRILTKCCYSDNCNKCKVRVPPYNNTLNGLICRTCYQYDSYDCKSKGYMYCKGNETYCIDVAAKMHNPVDGEFKFAMMGCVTEEACSLKQKIVPGTKMRKSHRLICTEAHPILH